MSVDEPETLHWFVDEIVHCRNRCWLSGWAMHTHSRIDQLGLLHPAAEIEGWEIRTGLPSPDVAEKFGERAAAARFAMEGPLPIGAGGHELELLAWLDDGRVVAVPGLQFARMNLDPYHAMEKAFWRRLAALDGGRVLELGSRNRSGNIRKDWLRDGVEYFGMDILEGDNVDVVGDAHELSTLFPPEGFRAVFGISVFEHLLMPWKVAVELNRVLEPGGVVFAGTHQTFPLHERPWDFWRYTDEGWSAIFNEATGFAIEQVAMGEPATIVPRVPHAVTGGVQCGQAYLVSGVTAKKIGAARVSWDVGVTEVLATGYPTPHAGDA